MNENIKEIRLDTKMATKFFAGKLAYTLGPVELKQMLKEKKVKLIDVRAKDDFIEGHIAEAISIPKDELQTRLSELSKNDVHVLYCYNQQCHLAAAAAFNLASAGYPVMELEGGINTWTEDFGFELVKSLI